MAGQGHRLSHSVFLDTVLVCGVSAQKAFRTARFCNDLGLIRFGRPFCCSLGYFAGAAVWSFSTAYFTRRAFYPSGRSVCIMQAVQVTEKNRSGLCYLLGGAISRKNSSAPYSRKSQT